MLLLDFALSIGLQDLPRHHLLKATPERLNSILQTYSMLTQVPTGLQSILVQLLGAKLCRVHQAFISGLWLQAGYQWLQMNPKPYCVRSISSFLGILSSRNKFQTPAQISLPHIIHLLHS